MKFGRLCSGGDKGSVERGFRVASKENSAASKGRIKSTSQTAGEDQIGLLFVDCVLYGPFGIGTTHAGDENSQICMLRFETLRLLFDGEAHEPFTSGQRARRARRSRLSHLRYNSPERRQSGKR